MVNQSQDLPMTQDRRRSLQAEGTSTERIKTGLLFKFMGAIGSLILAGSVVFTFFFTTETQRIAQQTFAWGAQNTAATWSRYLADRFEPRSVKNPSQVLDAILAQPEILYAETWNERGERIAQAKQAGVDSSEPLTQENLTQFQLGPKATWRKRSGRVLEVFVPVPMRPPLGSVRPSLPPGKREPATPLIWLRIGFSAAPLFAELENKYRWIVAGALALLAVGILMAWWLSRVMVSPVQHLARMMKLVAEDDEAYDEDGLPTGRRFRRINDLALSIRSGDELEQLADEFQQMVRKLEHSYEHLEAIVLEKVRTAQDLSDLAEGLKAHNQENEALIKERTREVVEKNLRLYEISEELQFQKEELIGMNEQLEKISRMKSEFLASMSHELRTPLNSIIGFAEVLKDKLFGTLNEKQDHYINNILVSGKHLLQLINNILDISKVEAGKMKLMLEEYDVNRVIDEVQNIIKTLAYKKNIEMTLDLAPNVVMVGDAAKMKQILYNLISNAIKFTEEKGRVQVRTERVPPNTRFEAKPGTETFTTAEPCIKLMVADSGIGIKSEDQERIFLEFEQSEQTRKKRYEGTGLGLALTRKIVLLHGGKIWVQSEWGQGSEFFVVLPQVTKSPEPGPETGTTSA